MDSSNYLDKKRLKDIMTKVKDFLTPEEKAQFYLLCFSVPAGKAIKLFEELPYERCVQKDTTNLIWNL